ncbi:hypothetical protein L7F22_037867 [Adiantum nelumboides]|nr:hypothetical protein [Adiantum nelumboides]
MTMVKVTPVTGVVKAYDVEKGVKGWCFHVPFEVHAPCWSGHEVKMRIAEVKNLGFDKERMLLWVSVGNEGDSLRLKHAILRNNIISFVLDSSMFKSIERYDPREALWSSMAPLHQKRGSLSATVLDGKIYAIGGYDGANILSSVKVCESQKDYWIEMESGMHCKRSYAAAVTVGHNIYVLGGYTGKQYLQSVEQYKMDVGWELVEHAFIEKHSFDAGIVL